MMMNGFESQIQESMKRMRWQERRLTAATDEQHHHHQSRRRSASASFYTRLLGATTTTPPLPPLPTNFMAANYPLHSNSSNNLESGGGGFDAELVSSAVVPAVTVVLEGRSICQRISLHKHASYQSLAKALRHMFVDCADTAAGVISHDNGVGDDNNSLLDLSNAVPGHLIAYEDMDNDLLLVGDLNWKDFVRVAKRIRILPVKANSRKGRGLGCA